MHLSPVTLSAAGDSGWIAPGPMLLTPSGLGLALTFTSNANLTASVQYTYDDPIQDLRPVTINRAATVATITDPGHGLNVGDNVQISQDPSGTFGPVPTPQGGPVQLPSSYDIASIVDQNNYTVTVANAGSVGPVVAFLQSFRVFTHPTMGNQAGTPPARIDGGFNWQIGAYRLKVSAYTAGSATLSGQQGKGY